VRIIVVLSVIRHAFGCPRRCRYSALRQARDQSGRRFPVATLLIPVTLAARIAATPELAVREGLTGAAEVRTSAAMLRDFDTIADFELAQAGAAACPA
jgi:hypothetical protein